jgi:DNA-binding CsgD family transcriptional regulator
VTARAVEHSAGSLVASPLAPLGVSDDDGHVVAGALVGRDTEVRRLESLLSGADSTGAALVLRGEPGIGKTALLREARSRAEARGMLVLVTSGVQSEMHIPYAGLHQLLRPVLSDADRLSERQREVLLAAFAPAEQVSAAVFPVALAVLELLSDTAARHPLLLEVEDAQWLDPSTVDVLRFVARRLATDRIVMLIALRDGEDSGLDSAGLAEMPLQRLDENAAVALLDAHAAGLPAGVRRRVLEDAAGNPLALLELPLASRTGPPGGLLGDALTLTTRLERAFAERASELAEPTRALLLLAALDDLGRLPQLLMAGARLVPGLSADALEPAISARLIELDPLDETVRFRHPLVRSAIRQAATVSQRRAAHAALAETLVGESSRQVWHRAASLNGHDEGVARDLEAAARSAERQGSVGVAVAALETAAQFTVEPAERGLWLLDAAELAFEGGRHEVGARLLEQSRRVALLPVDRRRLAWLHEVYEEGAWSGADRIPAFVEIAEQMRREGDVDRALFSLVTVALRCYWSNPDERTRALVVDAAERIPVSDDDPRLIAVLGLSAPVERGRVVIERLARLAADPGDDPLTVALLGNVATGVGALDQANRFLDVAVAGLRAQGRLGALAQALVSQAWAGTFGGAFRVAVPAAEEAERLARETGQERWAATAQALAATIAGLRGDYETAGALSLSAEQVLLPTGVNSLLSLVQLARGVTELGAGRHAEAYEQLRRIFDPTDTAYHLYVRFAAIGDLVEAAIHSGDHEQAQVEVERLEPLLERGGSPVLQAGLLYARPLLADDSQAEEQFQFGLSANLAACPLTRARLLLAYGSWLRRRRRVAESRTPLRAAGEIFEALGARPWHERTRVELRASGENMGQSILGALDQLSPQELQIAQLAAQGLSNRDIGQRLYLSHRTVGSHLYRMFPKLGITSRVELAGALGRG